MLPSFEEVTDHMPRGMGLSSGPKKHLRRKLVNTHDHSECWQVILNDGEIVLYHGFWPDYVAPSMSAALDQADELARTFLLHWEEIPFEEDELDGLTKPL